MVLDKPCKPGCCKTGIPGICYNKRLCHCHEGTDRKQNAVDDWNELQARS